MRPAAPPPISLGRSTWVDGVRMDGSSSFPALDPRSAESGWRIADCRCQTHRPDLHPPSVQTFTIGGLR